MKHWKPSRPNPAAPVDTLIDRYAADLHRKIEAGNPPEFITLYWTTRPDHPHIPKVNAEMTNIARVARIPIRYVDPTEWGFKS